MTNNHPITPPPELLSQWWDDTDQDFEAVAVRAARWGADQELEACLKWMGNRSSLVESLRTYRRPKPPSLKELAQAELDRLIALIPTEGAMAMAEPIRRALEKLDD